MKRIAFAVAAGMCFAAWVAAQDAPPAQEPQPYDRVITKDAKSKKGIFTVHQIKERYYYEIPKQELDKDFLWRTGIARTAIGAGFGSRPVVKRVVRWELSGNKVNLRNIEYSLVADPKTPIAAAVKAANNNAIIMSFPVVAFNKDGEPVIEVTRLFGTDVPEFSARLCLGATAVDVARSYIERITAFPENIEAEASMTYTRAGTTADAEDDWPALAPVGNAYSQMRPGSATVVLHHSMLKLPEKPMMPRFKDDRVGYFSIRQMDYGRDEHHAQSVDYILHWRLEKKDPSAAVSEPVKPIVYYIDPATPTKWVPWLKKGIESWQPAFEAAGFKNAIVAKDAPTPEQDPDWSGNDIRHSVLRWLPSTIEAAGGWNTYDPRSGEILSTEFYLYHNLLKEVELNYFVQAGPLDPRAQKLPFPDDLLGRLIIDLIAHEVGHTLGLSHNFKASSKYPQEKLRDPDWVKKMGLVPSVMDLARYNYVAQPEDKIDVDDLGWRVGPYDVFAIRWGYTPIPGAKTPDDEKPMLDKWAREQDRTPWLQYYGHDQISVRRPVGGDVSDPGYLRDAVGDADAVKSTALGMKNLERVIKMLIPATAYKEGEPYDDLREMYDRVVSQWTVEMNHVVAIVGGFDARERYIGQEGPRFTMVPKARQEEAVRFLNANAFRTPAWLLDRDILDRIEAVGILARIRKAQVSVLTNLLDSARFARLVEQEATGGETAYTPTDFLATVRKGVWEELDSSQVKIDAYRRNLQRAYLDLANTKVNGPAVADDDADDDSAAPAGVTSSGDERPFYRAELRALDASISASLAKATDAETKAHLEGAHDQIAKILDP
jgi:hypothetical protein